VGDNDIGDDKNAGKSTMTSMAMANAAVRRGVHRPMEHIQGFTRCRHRASARIALPRRLPWSTISNKTHKTLTNTTFS